MGTPRIGNLGLFDFDGFIFLQIFSSEIEEIIRRNTVAGEEAVDRVRGRIPVLACIENDD